MKRDFERQRLERRKAAPAARADPRPPTAETPAVPPALQPLLWTSQVLDCLVAAQLAQHTVCGDLAARLLTVPPPPQSGFGEIEANQRMLAWCGLLKVQSELAQAAAAADQPAAGRRAVPALDSLAPPLADQRPRGLTWT